VSDRRTSNIGTLRFIGAFVVLFGHGYVLSTGHRHDPISSFIIRYTPWHTPLQSLGVIIFFALSGYLVTQSCCNKKNVIHYFIARCLRIYPALIVAVLFCVLVVGLTQTTLPLSDYLCNSTTINYFFNNATLKVAQVNLPGVFEKAPVPASVNGSLWTLPIEFRLYMIIGVLGFLGVLKRIWLFDLLTLTGMLAFVVWAEKMPPIFSAVQSAYLVLSFALGALFYINRQWIFIDGKLALALLILCIVIREIHIFKGYYGHWVLLPFIYIVFYLAFMKYSLPKMDKYGDFSYGLYLYAYPLQQLCINELEIRTPLLVDLLAFLGALSLAIFSWYCVEKPALKFVPNGRFADSLAGEK
jgi:peptidoglycan/LPS O-acetylase OafA/YrhL